VSVFVDTNVFVYARDLSERHKQERARAWVDHLWDTGTGRLSVQVLNELYVVLTRRLEPGLPPTEARADVIDLSSWQPVPITAQLLAAAWTIEDRYGVGYWDSLIVAAAHASGAGVLLTEDLQHGQDLGGVRVVDPFQVRPDELIEG
jgi:predicted nucleic acid-binding protein